MNYTPQVDRRGGYRLPISPDRWGAVMWDTLHYVSLGYPEKDPAPEIRQAAFEFLRALPFLLPCSACREHLADAFSMEMPLEKSVFASRQALGEYIVQLRDLVKQKHVCPGCIHTTHSFPEDVATRLLRPPDFSKYFLIIPLSLSLFLFWAYRYNRPHGKFGVQKSVSFAPSSRRFSGK